MDRQIQLTQLSPRLTLQTLKPQARSNHFAEAYAHTASVNTGAATHDDVQKPETQIMWIANAGNQKVTWSEQPNSAWWKLVDTNMLDMSHLVIHPTPPCIAKSQCQCEGHCLASCNNWHHFCNYYCDTRCGVWCHTTCLTKQWDSPNQRRLMVIFSKFKSFCLVFQFCCVGSQLKLYLYLQRRPSQTIFTFYGDVDHHYSFAHEFFTEPNDTDQSVHQKVDHKRSLMKPKIIPEEI